ncbi:MAG: hypothetical protein H7343_14610 [Undibacterium sp.]|nr:hypothetical protein [Opitutaceae bacterium]
MSNPNPATIPAPRWFAWLAAVVLLGYGAFLGYNFTPVAGGSDSSGYLNAAQLLTHGQLIAPQRDFAGLTVSSAPQLQPLGFIADPSRSRLIPTYPLGLPAHLALASLLFGWTAGPLLIGVGATLAAMVLIYAIARELRLAWPLAAAGAVLLGAFPVTIFIAIQPLSDVLATTWVLATVFAAFRARHSLGWAVATGVALSVAVFVRPTNLLLLPTIAVLLGRDRRSLVATALGGLPGALLLLAANSHLFGSPWRLGYVSIAEAFSFDYFGPTLLHFVKWLGALLPGIILGLAVVGFFLRRLTLRERLALALWFFVPVTFYAFYEFAHEVWWGLRFILPAVPALILAALVALDAFFARRTLLLPTAAAILALWAAVGSVLWTRHFHTLLSKTYERAYADVGTWARAQLPQDTVILTNADSGALYYYTAFPILRWDQMSPAEFAAHAAHLTRAGRPLHLVIFVSEENYVLNERVPARWEKVAVIAQRSIWRYVGPATP